MANQTLAAQITLPMDAIREFCQRWNIVEFALFGSVLREDFDDSSDIDVLVRYQEGTRLTLDQLMTMGDELETIFNRRIDLVDRDTLNMSRNYLRREAILNSAQVVYAER